MPKPSFDEWRKNESTLCSESKKYKGKKEEEDKKKKEESAKKPFEGLAAALPDPVRTTENGVRIQDSKTAEKRANARANYQNKTLLEKESTPSENPLTNYDTFLLKNTTATQRRGDLYASTLDSGNTPMLKVIKEYNGDIGAAYEGVVSTYQNAISEYKKVKQEYDSMVKNDATYRRMNGLDGATKKADQEKQKAFLPTLQAAEKKMKDAEYWYNGILPIYEKAVADYQEQLRNSIPGTTIEEKKAYVDKQFETGQNFGKTTFGNAIDAPAYISDKDFQQNMLIDRESAKETGEDGFFSKGAFKDGYDGAGDIAKSAGATVGDAGLSLLEGAGKLGEGVVDFLEYGVAGVADLFGADDFADDVRTFAQKDHVDEAFDNTRRYTGIYKNSLLGNKSRGLGEGLGYIGGIALAPYLLGPSGGAAVAGSKFYSPALMFASGTGSGTSEAYQLGATDGEATAYGLTKGAVETISELIFGGLGKGFNALGFSKGLTSIDDMAAKKISNAVKKYITSPKGQRLIGNALEYSVKSNAEGIEEGLSGLGTAIAKDVILFNDKDEKAFLEILKDENLLEAYISGTFVSALSQFGGLIGSVTTNTDFVTEKPKNINKTEKIVTNIPETVVNQQQNTPSDVPSAESVSKPIAEEAAEPTADTSVDNHDTSGDTSVDISADTSVNGSVDTSVDTSVNASEEITVDPEFLEAFAEYEAAPENQPRNDKLPTAFPAPKLITEAEKFELYKYPPELRSRIRYADSLAEKTGVLYGASEETIKEAIELGNALGREVEFFSNDNTKIAGVFKDGTIKINVKAKKAAFKIFAHELTHSLKVVGNDSYQKLKAHVFSVLESEGKSREDAIKEKKAEYSTIQELTDELAEDEIVARFCADRLFTDAESIKALTKTDRTLAQRMRYLIDRLLAKLGNKNANERAILEKARRLYEAALAKSNDRDLSSGTVSSAAAEVRRVEGNDPYLKILASQLANGEITEAQFAEEYEDYVATDKRISGARAKLLAAESDRPRTLADMAEDFETEDGEEQYSINNIQGEKQNYGDGVILDTNIFDRIKPRNWGAVLKNYVYNKLAGREITIYDDSGKAESIYLARENDRVKKDGANNSHKVIDKLSRFKGDNIKALATVHISEMLKTSEYEKNTNENNHQWLDKNGWELRKTYIQDKSGKIYEATLNIAKGDDRNILYDISNIRFIDTKRAPGGDVSSEESIKNDFQGTRSTSRGSTDSISQNPDLSTPNPKKDFGNSKNGGGQFDYTPSSDETTAVAENEERADDSLDESYDYTKPFDKQIDDYKNGKTPKRDTLIVGPTPEVFKKIGFNSLPMTYSTGHLKTILAGNVKDHSFGEHNLKLLPSALENPIAIIKSNTSPNNSVVAIIDLSSTAKSLVAAVEIDGTGRINNISIDSNAITTVHSRPNAPNLLKNAISAENNNKIGVFYVDKKKANTFLNKAGVQFPGLMSLSDGFVHSIREKGANVNIKIKNVTKTKQFKRWFGDFEKHPKSSSKVVNADGSPMIMYHGTDIKNFSIFDSSFGNKKSELDVLGNGNYFTRDKENAKKYGTNIIECYLDIKKPYRVYGEGGGIIRQMVDDFGISSDTKRAEIQNILRENGYDGILLYRSKHDASSDFVTAVTFDSVQSKSASNNIGLYGQDNSNIYYDFSPRALSKEEINEVNTLIKTQSKKVQKNVSRNEKNFINRLSKTIGFPKFYSDSMQSEANEIFAEYFKNKSVSQETIDRTFESVYKKSFDACREATEKYGKVLDYIQKNKMNVPKKIRYTTHIKADSFITLSSENGKSIKDVYNKLREMSEDLFFETDDPFVMYRRIVSVGKQLVDAKKKAAEVPEPLDSINVAFQKSEFEEKITEMVAAYNVVTNYVNEMEAKKQAKEDAPKFIMPQSDEEIKNIFDNCEKARSKYYSQKALVLLTDYDKSIITRLLRNELTIDVVAEMAKNNKDINIRGITKIYDAAKAYDVANRHKTEYKIELRKNDELELNTRILKNADFFDDKRTGLAYATTTQERNARYVMKKIDPKTGKKTSDIEAIKSFDEIIVNAAKAGNAKAIRLTKKLQERIRALNISRDVEKGNTHSEDYAVQFLGEALSSISDYREGSKNKNSLTSDEVSILRQAVEEFKKANPNLDYKKIGNAISEFRKIYNELFDMMNITRMRNGIDPIKYRKNYFPHFESTLKDGFLRKLFKGLSVENTAKLPTSINGLTKNFKPNIQWFAHAQERKGNKTDFSALEGFDKYISVAADNIYLTDVIRKVRRLESLVRQRFMPEDIKIRIEEIKKDPNLTEFERECMLDGYKKITPSQLGGWAVNLNEYANVLAGKKSSIDRGMEDFFGREAYFITKKASSKVAANLAGANLASAIQNTTPIFTSGLPIHRTLSGLGKTIFKTDTKDNFIDRSDFLTNRLSPKPLAKTKLDTAGDVANALSSWIDRISSETIVRARYEQNIEARKMSPELAMADADAFAASVISDRSKGSMPTIFYSTNPLVKAFTMFQLEVKNDVDYLFKDMIKNKVYFNDKESKRELIQWLSFRLLGAFIFGELCEKLFNRKSTLDPISLVVDNAGELFEYRVPNIIDIILGWDRDFSNDNENIADTILDVAENTVKDIPFVGGLFGGGRIPLLNLWPDIESGVRAITGNGKKTVTDENGNEVEVNKWSNEKRLQKGLDVTYPLLYGVVPMGANQIKKTASGIKSLIDGGKYTIDNDGNDILQYPIYTETFWDKAVNGTKSVLFGPSSTFESRQWVNSNFDSLTKNETKAYREAIGAGVSQRDAYEMIRDLGECKKTDEQSRESVQKEYLRYSKMEGEGKLAIYYNMFASDEEKARIDALRDEDAEQVFNTLIDIGGKSTNTDKLPILIGAELSEDAKKLIYREKISDSRDDEIEAFEKVGLSFDDFLKVQSEYSNIEKEVEKEGGERADMALLFRRFVENGDYTKEQEEVILEGFKYYTQVAVTAATYEKYLGAGLSDGEAADIRDKFAELKPLSGKKTVSDIQKARVIVDAGLSDKKTMAALEITLSDSDAKRCKALCSKSGGIKPSVFVSFKEKFDVADSIEEGGNANGHYDQGEIQRAIELVAAIYSLTPQKKAWLWQSQFPESENNPYSENAKNEYSALLENN